MNKNAKILNKILSNQSIKQNMETPQLSSATKPRSPRQLNANLLHLNPVFLLGQPKEEKMQLPIIVGGNVN